MRVLFCTKYPRRGPSSRYRVYQFIPFLESNGFICTVQSLHDESYVDAMYGGHRRGLAYHFSRLVRRIAVLFAANRYDVVFIQKELAPYVPPVLEALLRRSGAKIVYDIDDAIFLFYTHCVNPAVRVALGGKIPRVLRLSDAVLAGNAYLRDYARRYSDRVALFPTVLDPSRYHVRYTNGFRGGGTERGEGPTVCWIGSPGTLQYLRRMAPVLERAAEAVPFRLLVIGAPAFPLRGVDVGAVPWSEDTEASELVRCDLGIMPLPGTQWAKGKCGLKLLQYMAAALPVVSSPDGGGTEIVVHGSTGLIARSDDEWVEHLVALLRDGGLRERFGLAGRNRVEERYSLDIWAPRLARIITRVASGEALEGVAW